MVDSIPAVIRQLRALAEARAETSALDESALPRMQAAAARLWLEQEEGPLQDLDDLRRLIKDYWDSLGGEEAYEELLRHRHKCVRCGEINRFENLSICPNCFKLYCCRHSYRCACGFDPVG
jgi:hypothetical protein